MPTTRQKQQSALLCALLGVAVVLALGMSLRTAHAQSTPTAVPTMTALPTILPDQTLVVLAQHGQAVEQLGMQPAGWGMVALLALWLGLHRLTSRRR